MRLLRPSSHYRERVLGLIRQRLWQESVDSTTLLAGVCDSLRQTRWTLNRHLREEGCHSALLEQVRREEACRLLQDPALQLQEVGGRLGFASQSSFSRFFKEAFALPSEYRSRRSRLWLPGQGPGEQLGQPLDEELNPWRQLAAMGIEA